MLCIKRIEAVALVGALAVSGSVGAAVYAEEKAAPVKMCLSKHGEPTNRCMEATRFSLRIVPMPSHRAADVDLIVQVGHRDLELVKSLTSSGDAADEVEICIVNGANICPPEPLKIVWICITTGMLAGSECPDWIEDSTGRIATIKLQSRGRR